MNTPISEELKHDSKLREAMMETVHLLQTAHKETGRIGSDIGKKDVTGLKLKLK